MNALKTFRLAVGCAAVLLVSGFWVLLSQAAEGQNPGAGAGGVVVLGERQPPALSSGLGIDVLGIPTGNNPANLPAPDLDANRHGPGVLVGFGQVVYDEVDMVLQGRDAATTVVIARRHLSRRNQENSVFGPAWAFNYRHTIQRDANGNVVMASFGRKDLFEVVAGSSTPAWEGTEGRFDRLTYEAGKYTMRMPHGTLLEFAADDAAATKPAHLTKISSPNGNTLVFAYDTAEPDLLKRRLFTITESFGRTNTFSYGADNSSPWVTKITDFSGRELVYDYNSNGQLLSVRSPTVNSTGGLNDFPNGKIHRYDYRNHANPKLQHALTSVIAPNQAATGSNLTRYEWTYRDGDVADPFFGYLKTYTLGNQTAGASADLRAGGTFSYTYKTSGEVKSDPNAPAWEIEVIDRRDTKTLYRVNRLGHVLSEAISNQFRGGATRAYIKSFEYNSDGQLTSRFEPLGARTDFIYASRREHPHNANQTIPRNSEINLTATVRFPDQRGAQQAYLRSEIVYDPIFNRPFKVTGARGFDATEKLTQNETDATLRQRFTTTHAYDYMEDLAAAKAQFAPLLGLTTVQLEALFTTAGITDLAADVNGDTLLSQRSGNLIKITHPQVPRPTLVSGENLENLGLRVGLSGNAEQAEELFRYNQFGQLVHHRDAEENVTSTAYFGTNDPDGDGTIDNSGADASTGGYVKETVRDAAAALGRNSGQNPAPVNQTTTFEYVQQLVFLEQSPSTTSSTFPANQRGVPTATIDPRGIKTAYLVNELDQVVKTVRAAAVGARAGSEAGLARFSYESVTLYDHNGNVLQNSIENEDTLDPAVDDLIVANRTYDILDQQRSAVVDAGVGADSLAIRNTVAYGPSQNPVEQVRGANNPATAPDHAKETFTYDERDIPSITTLGVEEGEPQQAAFENNIDANGNKTQHIDGEDADADDAADGAVGGDPTRVKFDGFDRQIEVIDRVGNRTTYQYDSAANVIRVQTFGPVDHSATTQIALSQTDTRYDERNRPFRVDHPIFHYAGKEIGTIDGGAFDPADGLVSSITLYDRLGRAVGTVDAEGDTFTTRFDGLSRVITTIDPLNNEVHTTYDLNHNRVQVQEVERSPLIATDEVFTSSFTYDALDRQITVVEPNGQTTTNEYDSRNNRIKTIDPLGNETEMLYDRLDRLVETRTYLSASGLNASSTNKDPSQSGDGIITIKQEWDDLNRLAAQIDDKTNRTEYVYDDLDRKVRTNYRDGTFETWQYNDDGDLLTHTNQNLSVLTYTYDAKSRRKELVVTHPAGLEVGGTTTNTWRYDGLDRVTLATDNNGPAVDDDVTCTYVFDSLSRQIRETQKIGALAELAIDTGWQGGGRKVSGTYPNARKINRSYDKLDRLSEIKEATGDSLISRFEYVGPSRDIRTTYGNDAVLDKRNSAGSQTISGTNPGYDSNRRSVRHEWKTGAGQQITAYVNTWNGPAGVGANRRASEQREHLSSHTDTYAFDAKYRMTGFRRDGTGLSAGGTLSTRALDGADKTATLTVGAIPTAIDLGANDEYARMNQYKAFAGQSRTYDHNSSLDADGAFKYIQDYGNRIGEIRRAADNSIVAQYAYDSNNRRVLRDVGGTKTRYLYDGWQVVEERGGNDAVLRQYVDGRGIDEHLQLKDGSTGNVYYYHSNSQGFVGALTDANGSVVEFYEYDWLGKPAMVDSDKTTPLAASKVNNPYFFQGRSLDPETATATSSGLYYFRNRYYSPDSGEFLTIDPLGYWNHGQGNGFSAFGEDGWNNADPMGLGKCRVAGCTNTATALDFCSHHIADEDDDEEDFQNGDTQDVSIRTILNRCDDLNEETPASVYKEIVLRNLGVGFHGEFDVLSAHGIINSNGRGEISFHGSRRAPTALSNFSPFFVATFGRSERPLLLASCYLGLDVDGVQNLANKTGRMIIAARGAVHTSGRVCYDAGSYIILRDLGLERDRGEYTDRTLRILVELEEVFITRELAEGWTVFHPTSRDDK